MIVHTVDEMNACIEKYSKDGIISFTVISLKKDKIFIDTIPIISKAFNDGRLYTPVKSAWDELMPIAIWENDK